MPYTNDKTVPRNSSEKVRKLAGATSIRPLAERGACQIKRGGGSKDPSWVKLRTWKPIRTHRPCIAPLYNGACVTTIQHTWVLGFPVLSLVHRAPYGRGGVGGEIRESEPGAKQAKSDPTSKIYTGDKRARGPIY